MFEFIFGKAEKKEKFIEAKGVTVNDNDDIKWRKLTGYKDRSLPSITQERMQEIAVHLWRTNMLANRMIELPLAYILAEGVKLTIENDTAQRWLDEFWNHPINNMDIKFIKKARELFLFGEQCYPAFVNEVTGKVTLGYIDPSSIKKVEVDPFNPEQPIGIITKSSAKVKSKKLKIIINGDENVFTKETQDLRASYSDGECFYFAINDLSTSPRGHSDLLAVADWLDAYDKALFGELERWDFLRAFIWDVTIKGATPDEVIKRAKEIEVPTAGGTRIHNENEVWQAVTPDLATVDGTANARLFRNHLLGGVTLPEFWYGGGGDVNRATAGEMGNPTFKIFTFKQKYLKYMLEYIAQYVIAKRLEYLPRQIEMEEKPTAIFPALTVDDTTIFANALQQVVISAVQGVQGNVLPKDASIKLVAAISKKLGVDFDPEAALEEIEAKALKDDVYEE